MKWDRETEATGTAAADLYLNDEALVAIWKATR